MGAMAEGLFAEAGAVVAALPPLQSETLMDKGQLKVSKNAAAKAAKDAAKKKASAEKVAAMEAEMHQELDAQSAETARIRATEGAYKGAIDTGAFILPNPGGGQPLLEDARLTLVQGHRYALIGRNGKGKSTLLKAMAARRVGALPLNMSVHYVSQDVHLGEKVNMTPLEVVLDADIERKLLLEEAAQLEKIDEMSAQQQHRQGEVLDQLELIAADSAPRRALSLLHSLGFSDEMQGRVLGKMSGGWRVRTMLAAAIFARPDMLLLDEPTNHLSILAVMWLSRELATNPVWAERIVVVVSHDRFFIDEVCTHCLHISGVARRLTQHSGNYSVWAKRRREQQAVFAKQQELRQEKIETLKEYAGHGFRYGGSTSQINMMMKKGREAEKLEGAAAEDMEESAALQEDVELPIQLCSGGDCKGFAIQLCGVSFGYPNSKTLYSGVEFGVTSKSRIVLLGENGNGKTTLVNLMLGHLHPTKGEVKLAPGLRVALVNQHHADQIDMEMTPLEYLLDQFPGDGTETHKLNVRSHLANCGVTGQDPDLQNVPAAALSGGQRSRVALAAVSFAKPHVLFLDEPTNNLDLESVAALADSVKTFDGAVIVVSHDQFFVGEVADEAWVVNDGAVEKTESFLAYRKKQLAKLSKMK
eukprot:TRINITY_DN17957_c0_g1_i3.p1 TRINITY_DN17957_c0_g1~~TRINITY_DN17957_c0_g1_i3.p1  ORF type:complete len:644 (-),score=181.63 TRINITY_DN17957_c0_g1_i3:20-1951(-)